MNIGEIVVPPVRGWKTSTISSKIRAKMEEWLRSLPESLSKEVREDVIVTGGAIASMLLGDEPNDYDVYLRTKKSAVALAKHYVNEFNKNTKLKSRYGDVDISVIEFEDRVRIKIQSAGVAAELAPGGPAYGYFRGDKTEDNAEEFIQKTAEVAKAAADGDEDKKPHQRKKYDPVHLSDNAITLWGQVQVIIRFYGEPAEIHKNYDFAHCTNWWTPGEGLQLNLKALECLLTRTLIYQGSLYPLCSLLRVRKFINRGWACSAGQILKMMFQINELELDNVETLREQLVGVDAAYFEQLMHAIDSEKKMKPDLKIDACYIAKLIDTLGTF